MFVLLLGVVAGTAVRHTAAFAVLQASAPN
jgi:hypothetical protein